MKYFLICSFLFATCFVDAQSATLRVADSLYNRKEYFESSVWFERSMYEDRSEENNMLAIRGKLKCLKANRQYADALDFCAGSLTMNISESFRTELLYQQIFCSYLSGKFENVSALSIQYADRFTDKKMIGKICLLKILSYNELMKWHEADSIYLQYLTDNKLSANKINEYYGSLPHLKSEKKAKTLATFLPGAGQIYSGKILEGSLNTMLVIGSLAFGVEVFLHQYYISSWLFGGGMVTSFYYGGIRRTELLVKQHNQRKVIQYNEELKQDLVNWFSNEN